MGAAVMLVLVLVVAAVALVALGLLAYAIIFGIASLVRLFSKAYLGSSVSDTEMAVVEVGGPIEIRGGREYYQSGSRFGNWAKDKILMGMDFSDYLKAQLTWFNAIAAVIVMVGLVLTVIRFTQGLAATTNLTDNSPWGLWIGFDVLCGVATAAGGYTMASTVYIFRLKEYRPIVRPAILTGFLGYAFVVIGLSFDLGRAWRLPYPIFVSYGVTSVMFLVGWHVMLYLSCQFVEFCPAIFEWLGWKKVRAWAVRLTFGATIFGVMLSTLHQSALGGLFLMAPAKLHPLWYSPLLPVFFFVSSLFTGISMVIIESTLSHKFFQDQLGHEGHEKLDILIIGLAKAASVIMFTYFGLKIIGFMHNADFGLLASPYGAWYLVEMLGFVLLPCLLYVRGYLTRNPRLIRFTAVLTVVGIMINRFNVSMIAMNWNQADRYFPRWSEIAISIAIVTVAILTFRWIVNRMPVLRDHPDFEPE